MDRDIRLAMKDCHLAILIAGLATLKIVWEVGTLIRDHWRK